MKEYNGHPSYNAWNISLWIANDEPLYRFALECLRGTGIKQATDRFMSVYGSTSTPDGVLYTKTNVKRALAGLEV